MDKEQILQKEVDIIQSVITRMANNSFLLKGWFVSLVAVIIALTKDSILQGYITLSILFLASIAFWYLDSYYLRQEKMFRKLYDWVIKNRRSSDEHIYDLTRVAEYRKEVNSLFKSMLSKTILPLYGLFSFLIICVMIRQLIKCI